VREVGSAVRRERCASEVMPAAALTPAEVRILELLPTHLTLAQIAADMFIARNTAKSQVAAIYRKLSVASRDEAVRRARETGLLPARADAPAEPARGDDQARVLALPRRPAPEAGERDPEAVVAPQTPRPAAQIHGQARQRDSLSVSGERAASLDPVMVMARNRAARNQAGKIGARAHQARQMSFRLRMTRHRPWLGSSDA
jgi:DNA-binding CsgD family transcriptional regulator